MSILTFKNIQDQVLTFLDQAGDTGTGLTLVKYAIATAHAKRAMLDRWSFMLWPTPINMTFTTGQRNFILHPAMGMMTEFMNTTANEIMKETPSRVRFKEAVNNDRFHFEFVKTSPVSKIPAAGQITTVGKALITYMNTSGDIIQEEVDSTHTTFSVTDVINVTHMENLNPLTLTDAGSNVILSLASTEMGKTYPQIRLFADGAGETGAYRFYRIANQLVNDNDVPDIPYPFSNVLVYDALLELATYNDSTPQVFWMKQQADWDLLLRQTYLEGEMEGSEGRTIHEIDLYGG